MSAIKTSFLKLAKTEITAKELEHFLKFVKSTGKRVPLDNDEKDIYNKLSAVLNQVQNNNLDKFNLQLQPNGLGRLVDAGNIVSGSARDQYWQNKSFKNYTGADFIKDNNLVDTNCNLKTFGLKSIEYGNWLNDNDRLSYLYATSKSLMDLAMVLNIKKSDIGLNQTISIGFGSRGVPNSAAHYSVAPFSFINLTKKFGNKGSLAHEWGHALDNQIAVKTGLKRMVSGADSVRKTTNTDLFKNKNPFVSLMERIFDALLFEEGKNTAYHNRHLKLTQYYNQRAEMWARLVEVYIFNKLKKAKIKNIFLVKDNYTAPHYCTLQELEKVNHLIDLFFKLAFDLFNGKKLNYNYQPQLFGLADDVKQVVNVCKEVKSIITDLPNELASLVTPISQKFTVEKMPLKGEICNFLGELEKKKNGSIAITLDGDPGAGKTRFAFQYMNELALNGLKGLFVCLEEAKDSALILEKRNLYIDPKALPNIYILSDLPNGFDSLIEFSKHFDFVVVDSWQKVKNSFGKFDDYRKGVDGKILLVIFQQTANGEMRGGASSSFDGDIILKSKTFDDYKQNYIYPVKNRYNETSLNELAYSVFNKKQFNPQTLIPKENV